MIRIRRRIILIMLHFRANVKGNFHTLLRVAESSHLFTNVLTDTQTHRQTDKPSEEVQNIMPFSITMLFKLKTKFHIHTNLMTKFW